MIGMRENGYIDFEISIACFLMQICGYTLVGHLKVFKEFMKLVKLVC